MSTPTQQGAGDLPQDDAATWLQRIIDIEGFNYASHEAMAVAIRTFAANARAALAQRAASVPAEAVRSVAERQPMIGRLLDEFSALPVLWGLNEPGALVRHGQVFDMMVKIGKEYAAPAPAASVQAELQGTHVVYGDDAAVDLFAAAMKAKMAASRAKGRSGWNDPEACPVERLRAMMMDHITKGDPVDVGNFAMMLYNRNESTATVPQDIGRDAALKVAVLRDSLQAARYAFSQILGYVDTGTPRTICTKQMQSIDSDLAKALQIATPPANVAQAGTAAILEQAAQACDQQADGTNGPYRSGCLACASAVRALCDETKGGA